MMDLMTYDVFSKREWRDFYQDASVYWLKQSETDQGF